MAVQKPRNAPQPEQHHEGIARITVGGFKSIAEEQSIEIRPLTILAGANSSGKSSIMQPLLSTKITSADLDETGAFGDWPEDFATVTLESEDRYLDAAQKSLKGN